MSNRQVNTDQKNNKKIGRDQMPKPINNGVVITVYVESPSTNIRPPSESHIPSKKVKRNPVSRKCKRSEGYDRRAELLAYAQELRAGDNNEKLQWKNEKSSTSKHKSKKWKCPTTPRKLGNSFLGILRKTQGRWKYQRVPSDKAEEDYKRNDNNSTGKKKKERRRIFWRKLKRMLRGLSNFWQRKKKGSGGFD